MALEGFNLGTSNSSTPGGTALKGFTVGAAPAAPARTALPNVTFPSGSLDTSMSKIGDTPVIAPPKAADTSSSLSKFLGFNNMTPASTPKTESSTPAVTAPQLENQDNSAMGIAKNTLKGLPAASDKVTKAVTDTVIGNPAELLSNTDFIKESAAGIDAGSVSGNTAQGMLQKLSLGTQAFTGITGGLIHPENLDPEQGMLDKGLAALTQGLGMAVGVSSIGKVLAPLAGGGAAVNALTNFVNKYPLVSKYIAPFIAPFVENAAGFAAYGQLDPKLAGNLQARGIELTKAIGEAPLFTALGAIKSPLYSLPASFGLGFTMAKLSGASNQDAVASGLAFSFLDAAGRATGERGFTAEEMTTQQRSAAADVLSRYSGTKVTADSSAEDLKAAYYKAAHQTHPDVGGTHEAFSAVSSAYDLLSRGAVSSAPKQTTEAEQSIKLLKSGIKDITAEHNADVAHQALVDHLGVDNDTAARLVTAANRPEKLPELPKTDEKITSDSIAHVGENLPKLVDKYVERFGARIGADEAKELVPGYAKDRSTSDLVQKAASQITDAVYDKQIETKQGQGNNTVLITAGGTGAGKSTAVGANTRDYPVIYDTNLSNGKSGISRINKALDKGFKVDIKFVYAPIEEAYGRVLGRTEQMAREKGTGRPVSAQGHIDMHHGSYDGIKEVMQEFKNNPNVDIQIIDNSGKSPVEVGDPVAFIDNLVHNKENENQLHQKLTGKRESVFTEGGISEQTNKAFERAEGLRPKKEQPVSQELSNDSAEGALDRSVAASVLETEAPQADIDELSPELKAQADQDWQDHYADEYGDLATRLSEIEKELKTTKDKTDLELERIDTIAKQVELEGEFTFKWRRRAGMPVAGGFINVGKIVEDADSQIKDFIEKTLEPIELSDNLTDSFNKLEGAAQADLETIDKIIRNLPITKVDDEALYMAAENPDAELTPHQRELKKKFDEPLRKANQMLYERIKNDGTPLPDDGTYIARFPKEKPSVMQKVFNPALGRDATAGQGSVLSKSTSSLKKRTMKSITDANGKRTVVSIKDKKVTAFKDKVATDLGPLKVKKNADILEKELKPIQEKIAAMQKESEILRSVRVGTTGAEARLASVEDKAFAISADLMGTSRSLEDGLSKKDKAKLRELIHDMRLLSKVKSADDIVLRKQRLQTLQKKIIEATNLMADVEGKFDPEELNQKVFTDKDGNNYTIGEATTQEIEQHTNLEYYHSAMASRLMQYVKLRQIDRANQFLESWKNSADFAKIAVKNDKIPPQGWKMTTQVNFRNYYFEPRTSEALDDMQRQMSSGNYNNAFTGINRLLADSIFFNGLAHPINVFTIWLYNRGVSGVVYPPAMLRGFKAGARALEAMQTKNEDYMTLLREGAHLMSSDVNTKSIAKTLADKLQSDLEQKPDLADKLARALGYTLQQGNIRTNVIYKLSHDMAWLSNDFFTLQSIFETMDSRGLTMSEAIAETARFIPDYRQKTRLLDKPLSAAGKLLGNQEAGGNTARFLAKSVIYNRSISMFGSYHVGLMESLKNTVVDTAKGTDWTFSQESNSQRLKSADKFVMLALMMMVIYPWLDKLVQGAFGPTSYITRSGITKYPYIAYKVMTGDMTVSQAAQQVITPAVLVWELLQQFADHDFFTGDQITGAGNEGRINHALGAVAPFVEFQKSASKEGTFEEKAAEFGATFLGVHTPKNQAIAYQLNTMIYDEKPKVSTQVKAHVAAGDTEGGTSLAADFNQRLSELIRENDIATNGATTDERVAYFLNQYGLKMPGQTAMDNYLAKQGQNIVQKTLPNGQPVIKQDEPVPSTGVIGVITTYAKAIGTDPVEAFQLIFSGQTIKTVTNRAIIVNRMSLADSEKIKKAGGGDNPDFKLDHIVPLEGGGDNSDSNLQLIPTAQWQSNTNVENFIGSQLKAGSMSKDQAREIAIRFKAGQGEVLSPALLNEYNTKYGGKPLTEQEVYSYATGLDK